MAAFTRLVLPSRSPAPATRGRSGRPPSGAGPSRRPVHAVALVALALLAGGCATQPALEPGSEPPLSVSEAREAPPDAARRVRWGGTIAGLRNTAAGTSVLEVVSRPLRRDGRPVRNDVTDGRFLAEVDGFLDPEIVKAGRDVTVTGRVDERRTGQIGELDYVYPVVAVEDYRYWTPRPPPSPAHFPHPAPLGSEPHGVFGHGWPHHHHHYHHRRRGSGASVSGSVRF